MQTIGGREPLHGDLGRFYDAIENPRKIRGELPILRDAELRSYMADVRERTLDVLEGVEIDADVEDPLLRDGFVYEMLLAHELQHNETMLQLLQLVEGYELPPMIAGRTQFSPHTGDKCVRVGRDGRDRGGGVRDRRPAARLRLRQRATAAHGRARCLRDRSNPGHERRVHLLHGGHRRRAAALLGARRRAGGSTPPAVAASRSTPAVPSSTSPGTRPTPSPAGPASACRPSSSGRRRATALDGLGHGWEWTSSDFLAYPGFEAFPYREYSEVFFGDKYKVLRGSSWATHPRVARPSFRNWDLPQRNQIFAGIRCARDA